MDIHRVEALVLRYRAVEFSVTGGGNLYWEIDGEGSYLSIIAGDAGAYTLNFSLPGGTRSGTIIRVHFYQDQSPGGGATITWPTEMKFQTAGDALPNSNYQFLTAWEGMVWTANANIVLMTKLGEWDLS